MPFQSEKQRRYMHANLPKIANRWEKKYGSGGIAELNAELNSLPEYFMNSIPAAQGGRIGFDEGTISPALKKRMLELLLQGVPPHKLKEEAENQLRQDPYIKERMNIPGSPVVKEAAQGGRIGYTGGSGSYGEYVQIMNALEMEPMPKSIFNSLQGVMSVSEMVDMGSPHKAHGGLISSHEAGIYGLAEGGRTGFFTGMREAEQQAQSSGNQGSDQGHSRFEPGSGYYGETKTTTTTADKGDGNIRKGPQEGWTEDEVTIAVKEGERKKALRDLALQGEKTEKWEQAQTWNKPTITPGSVGVNLLTTFLTGGISNPWTKAAANKVVKWGANKIGVEKMINTFVDEPFGSIDEMKSKIEARVAKEDLIQSLPKGHPERIQLEGLKKETITRDGPNGNGVETSIKIENIEEVNDDKTQLLKKYKEMDEASRLAWLRQQEMQAKKEAWLKQLRQTYMSAQGGRVPGYNTGGLSNLFRLKNV